MKLSVFLAIQLITLGPILAQGWEAKFGGNSEEQGVAIIPTVDEGFIEVGFSESFGSDNDFDIYVVRTDVDGTLLWERIYDEAYIEIPGDLIQLEDGSLLIVGYILPELGAPAQVYLLSLGARGEVQWSKRYENNGFDQRGTKIIPTEDGGYAIVGKATNPFSGEDDILFIKLDENAEEAWRVTHGSTERDDEGRGIVEIPSGYMVAANIKGDSGPDKDIALYRLNHQGGLLGLDVYGTENLNEEVNDLIKTADGNVVLVGSVGSFNRGYVMKSDFNGSMLWEREIDFGMLDDLLSAVIELPDGSLVSVGTTITTASTPDILLVKLAADGEVMWERNLGEEFQVDNFGQDLALAADGGFVIGGHNAASGILINDMILLKVDGEGNYFSNVFRGKVFWTADGCNEYVEGDPLLAGWLVEVTGDDQTFYGLTNENGQFAIAVDEGSYTVTLLQQNSTWDICPANGFLIDFDTPYDTLEYNFRVREAQICPLLEVNTTAETGSVFLPCSEVTYDVAYCNQGAGQADEAYMELELDDELTFLDASVDFITTDSSILVPLGDLPPLDCGSFSITVQVACEGVLNGQSVMVTANIYPSELCAAPSPDWDMSSLDVSGACEGDQIIFKARNIGQNPTNGMQSFVVIEDQIMYLQGFVDPLNLGEEEVVASVSANEIGSTYRLIVEQVAGHPGASYPTIAVEGCTQEGNDNYVTGQVTQFPENDQDPFVDIDVQEIEVPIAANTLLGHPRGYQDSIITPTTDLEYTVYFVNPGTDTLNRLVIRDTLPAGLDVSSLTVGPASHPYEFTVYHGGVLKITFENLNLLPDGSGVETDSRGFVKYALSQKLNNPLGTVIENNAAVYFDYEAPLMTNMVRYVVGCEDYLETILDGGCLLVVDTDTPPADDGLEIKVHPNPFTASAEVSIKGCDCSEVEFVLRDALGREVRREQHAATSFTFQRQNLPPALYFFEVRADGQTLRTGKMLVQ
ncbi:MAG: DUF11 domain-containing protein [Lewinella sp.]|nr:DUF11 domain-containing protein [Lewinella sp.]